MKLSVYCGLRAIAYIITQGSNVVKHGIKKSKYSLRKLLRVHSRSSGE
ncbi:MAG: hypothetical protein IPK11_16085 [Ignavibacteria bacterium]|nr:hypothetical protein [Ignavibacteria bacterium]